MREPIWVDKPEVLVAHSMQLAQHGGLSGMKDETLLNSTLAKPRNVFAYSKEATLPRLAASYAFEIARNHPFLDGNKRTALVVCEGFLRLNGFNIKATQEEKYFIFFHLASGDITEERLNNWILEHLVTFER